MQNRIYLDNASTTRVDDGVLEEMMPFFTERYGNASSPHSLGQDAKEAMEDARARVAKALNAEPGEVIFTSGGTESDNLAIFGVAEAAGKGHIITSAIEHPAVMGAVERLEKRGFSATYVPVTPEGVVDLEALECAVRKDTVLITIMHANNEIGTIQPLTEISKIARSKGIPFHTDAVQAFGKIKTDVRGLGIDMLSLSAHKIHGPKGVGALYVRKGISLAPMSSGGGHERGLRSGTENVPGIVGLGAAAMLSQGGLGEYEGRIRGMRDRLIKGITDMKDSRINGSRTARLPHNVNASFKFIEGEGLLLLLDAQGIQVSTASACSSKSLKPSHVLLALGLSAEDAHGSLRITMSKYTREEDVDRVMVVLPGAVQRLRSMSPFKTDSDVKTFSEKHATGEDEDEEE